MSIPIFAQADQVKANRAEEEMELSILEPPCSQVTIERSCFVLRDDMPQVACAAPTRQKTVLQDAYVMEYRLRQAPALSPRSTPEQASTPSDSAYFPTAACSALQRDSHLDVQMLAMV